MTRSYARRVVLPLAVLMPIGLLGGCGDRPRYPDRATVQYPPPYCGRPYSAIGSDVRRDGWGRTASDFNDLACGRQAFGLDP
jgi:hypothetical protein